MGEAPKQIILCLILFLWGQPQLATLTDGKKKRERCYGTLLSSAPSRIGGQRERERERNIFLLLLIYYYY